MIKHVFSEVNINEEANTVTTQVYLDLNQKLVYLTHFTQGSHQKSDKNSLITLFSSFSFQVGGNRVTFNNHI